METTVFDVVHMFSERGISAVPIIDENGIVRNMYETVDVTVRHISLPLSATLLTYPRLSCGQEPTQPWTTQSNPRSPSALSTFRE